MSWKYWPFVFDLIGFKIITIFIITRTTMSISGTKCPCLKFYISTLFILSRFTLNLRAELCFNMPEKSYTILVFGVYSEYITHHAVEV